MSGVFFAQDGVIGGYAPIYPKAVVKYANATVCLRVIEIVAFILENGQVAKHRETMGKPVWDEN